MARSPESNDSEHTEAGRTAQGAGDPGPTLTAGTRVDYSDEVSRTRNPNLGIHTAAVIATRRLTPTMVRVTLGGDEVRTLESAVPDQRVKIFLPPDGLVWEGDPPTAAVPWAMPPGPDRPRHRTYTVRRLDPGAGEMDLDIVLHEGGAGSAWAEQAAPGQRISFIGPAGRWFLKPSTQHLVLVADEAGLPAVAAIIESLPSTVRATALLEVAPTSRQALGESSSARVTWFDPTGRSPVDEPAPTGLAGCPVTEAVRDLALTPGGVQAWGGAEQAIIRRVRHHLLVEQGFTRDDAYLVAYWRRGVDEQQALPTPANTTTDGPRRHVSPRRTNVPVRLAVVAERLWH